MARRKRSQTSIRQVVVDPAPARFPPQLAGLAVFVVIAFAAFVRLRLLDVPLERDEGEYAYAGQLLLHGFPPYSLAFNMKFPGTYLAYALFEGMFGETATAVHLGLILVTALTTLLLYFLGARLLGRLGGVITAAAHAVLALSITAMGPFAHATHFVVLFAVAGVLILAPRENGSTAGPGGPDAIPLRTGAMYASGVLLALSILMKQSGATFAIFAAAWLAFRPNRGRNLALLTAGGLTVGLFTTLWLVVSGAFHQFWFWTVGYAREYAGITSGSEAAQLLRDNLYLLFQGAPFVFLVAATGAVVLFVEPEVRRRAAFIGGFVLAGILAVLPGFYFRPHYFLTAMPGAALLCGVAVAGSSRLFRTTLIPAIAFAAALIAAVVWQAPWLLHADAATFMNVANADNPFLEAPAVGDYLREHTAPADRIAILGSEPEIYFYAKRRSATGYIYAYPLMEHQKYAHQMQLDMIRGIEAVKPKYLLMVGHAKSWLAKGDSDRTIFDWYTKTTASGLYALDAFVDDGRWVTGADAMTYQPRTKNVIVILKRRS